MPLMLRLVRLLLLSAFVVLVLYAGMNYEQVFGMMRAWWAGH